MNRRAFIGTLAGGLLSARRTAAAGPGSGVTPALPGGRLPRVGYLGSGYPADRSAPRFSYLFEALPDGLREGGYVDGRTVEIEYRWAEERYERLPDLAAELVRLGADVIYATTEIHAVAAMQATRTIPIVFNAVADPVANHFAASLSRPGGNMTGFTHPGPQVTEKLLTFLAEAVPKLSRVAVLRNRNLDPAGKTSQRLHLAGAKKAARTLRLQPHVFDVDSPQNFERVFVAMAIPAYRGSLCSHRPPSISSVRSSLSLPGSIDSP